MIDKRTSIVSRLARTRRVRVIDVINTRWRCDRCNATFSNWLDKQTHKCPGKEVNT